MTGPGDSGPRDIDTYCDTFLGNTDLIGCVQRTTPDLYAELVGIAEGADQPLPRIVAYNLMDEQWWYDARPAAELPGCSLIAMPVTGGHLLAQNMDLPAHMDGSQVVLRLRGDDIPETIVLSAVGMIGLTGANAAGLGVAVNTLLMLHHSRAGLPVAFALRHALAARDRAQAARRQTTAHHASGQHYAVASRDGLTSMECSATSTTPLPLRVDGRLLHTNHPLASEDIDDGSLNRLNRIGSRENSERRLDWLEARSPGLSTAEDIRAAYDDTAAPICMTAPQGVGSRTFATVVYALTDTPAVQMRSGFAARGKWQAIPFRTG